MKVIDQYDYVIPTYAFSYLVNNDASGLNDDEIRIIDAWCSFEAKQIQKEYPNNSTSPLSFDGETYFSASNCIDGHIGNDVQHATIYIYELN